MIARLLVALPLLLACTGQRSAAPVARSEADDRVVRVLVWNVHAGADAAGVPNLERVAARIRAERADVVLLQELDRGATRSAGVDQPATLARLTGLAVAFGKSLDFQGGDYGIGVLARWPIETSVVVPLVVDPPQARSGGLTTPRVALVTRLRSPHGTLVLVNSHIDAQRDDRWRRQEAAQLAALVDSLVRHEGSTGATVLLGGDMNSEPASVTQALLRGDAGERRDAWTACGGAPDDSTARTYPAAAPVKRIDYLYLTGRASCRAARVLEDQASDHRALLVEVSLGRD